MNVYECVLWFDGIINEHCGSSWFATNSGVCVCSCTWICAYVEAYVHV